MTADPTLSIVVPAYNVQEYLADCLWSVLRQELDDIEVIVVDDASPDASGAIANDFATHDARVRVIRHDGNRGPGAARNTGLDAARGRYVAFADGDDLTTPHAYATMVASLERTGSDFATGPGVEFGARRRRYWTTAGSAFDTPGERVSLAERPGLIEDHTPWSKVFRRSFVVEHGIRWPEGVGCEDVVPSTLAYVRANAVDVFTETIYHYRRRRGSLTTALGADRALTDWLTESARCVDIARDAPPAAVRVLAQKILREMLNTTRLEALGRAPDEVGERARALAHDIVGLADPSHIVLLRREHQRQLVCILYGDLAAVATRGAVGSPSESRAGRPSPMLHPSLRAAMHPHRTEADVAAPQRDDDPADADAPELSVVIAVRDAAVTIDETLRSVRACVGVRLEVIVVDDGSSDDTRARVDRHAAADPRIRVVRSTGTGLAAALDVGVTAARGRHLAFAAGDGIVPPEAYRAMLDTARTASADVVTGRYLRFSPTKTSDPTAEHLPSRDEALVGTLADLPQLLHPRTLWNRVFRTSFWNDRVVPLGSAENATAITSVTSALTAAERLAFAPVFAYIDRDRPVRATTPSPAAAEAATASALAAETRCLDVLDRYGDQAVAVHHGRTLLTEVGWACLVRYLGAQRDDEVAPTTVPAAVARLLARVPAESVRALSPEQHAVWALTATAHLDLAAALVRASRTTLPFDEVLALMRGVVDAAEVPDRVLDDLLWTHVVRRALEEQGALSPSVVAQAAALLAETTHGRRCAAVPGSEEAALLARPADVLTTRTPAVEHPRVWRLSTEHGDEYLISAFAPDAVRYRSLLLAERGASDARPVPVAIIEPSSDASHWRARIRPSRLPAVGTWDLWVEYETDSAIRRVRTQQTVQNGYISSHPLVEARIVAVEDDQLLVSVTTDSDIVSVTGLRLTAEGVSFRLDGASSEDAPAAYVSRTALSAIDVPSEAELTVTATVRTAFGESSVPLEITPQVVETRRGSRVAVAAGGRLRLLDPAGDGGLTTGLFERHLAAIVSRAALDDEHLSLHVTPANDAVASGLRLWRRAEGHVYTRGFMNTPSAAGALVSTRRWATLEGRLWTMLVRFETPIGPVEHPVDFDGELVNASGGARLEMPGGPVVHIEAAAAPTDH